MKIFKRVREESQEEEQNTYPVNKMARIEEIEVAGSNTEITKKYTEEETKIKLVEAQYTLNDLKALEKKFERCYSIPIDISEEADDGSSIHVDLKTSLFEAFKNNFLQVLRSDPNIEKAVTTRVTKAKSSSGIAEVEYMAEIVLEKGGNKHAIILKCFTTNCRIQVQKRGKHTKFVELGNKYVPKYFMDFYIIPFAKKILISNPELDELIMPALAEEIQRLRSIKAKNVENNKKGKSIDDMKCVSAQCKQKITKNVNVSAQCNSCKHYEHFKCAGTTATVKEDIKEDITKFICSVCLEGNPLLAIQIQIPPQIEMQEIVPEVHSILELELEEIVEVQPEVSAESQDFRCDLCGKAFITHEQITEHMNTTHRRNKQNQQELNCTKCSEIFNSKETRDDHVQKSHTEIVCEECGLKCATSRILSKHIKQHHDRNKEINCNKCTESFHTEDELNYHLQNTHVEILCETCSCIFTTEEDLKKHQEGHDVTSLNCKKCEYKTTDKTELETHMESHEASSTGNNLLSENVTLKRQNQILTDSYERLVKLYNNLKEESNKEVGEYKKNLEEAQENLRVALTENEKLRETNDVQHNLWKIWLQKHGEEDNKQSEKNMEMEKESTDDNSEDTEDLVATFVRNRRNGFIRTNPAAPAQSKAANIAQAKKVSINENISYNPRTRANHPNNNSTNKSKRYCYYWNNIGSCSFRNCIFLHEVAPVCKYDGNCNRNKCMYVHKKQNKSFLSNQPAQPRSTAPKHRPSSQRTGEWSPSQPSYWSPTPPAPWSQTQWRSPWVMTGSMGNQRQF